MGFLVNRIRTTFWTLFYRIFGVLFFDSSGKNCRFEGWIDIPQLGGKITLGNNVRICRMVEISIPKSAFLGIGDNCFIGRGVMLSGHEEIIIGRNTLLAEYVCIHDNDHLFADHSRLIQEQGFESKPILIGDDCWIGAKSVVLKGATLGSGCVIGAGAVVTGGIPPYSIAVGSPARVVRSRWND